MNTELWGRVRWLAWVAFDRARAFAGWAFEGGKKMFGLGWLPILAPVVAAAVVGTWVWVEKEIEISRVRSDERAVCMTQIASIRDQINEAADLRVAAAEAAALEVKDPATAAELDAICKKDPYCRDREAK